MTNHKQMILVTHHLRCVLGLLCISAIALSQPREYIAKRASAPLQIDGVLSEADWGGAALTEPFLLYGRTAHNNTQAKILWDDTNLYIAFICEDTDVWTTFTKRDSYLYQNDVVEVFLDPDGDGLNYAEFEVSPLNIVADLLLDKPYSAGGHGNWGWNLDGMLTGVTVNGTVNVRDSLDTLWTCEMALPFEGLAPIASSMAFPPKAGDSWRGNLFRQDYLRTPTNIVEPTSWSATDSAHGFHVPSTFGTITFSGEVVSGVKNVNPPQPATFALLGNYPNPFNPITTIKYTVAGARSQGLGASEVRIVTYDVLGREVATLLNARQAPGTYEVRFDGSNLSSGVYFYRLTAGSYTAVRKMTLMK